MPIPKYTIQQRDSDDAYLPDMWMVLEEYGESENIWFRVIAFCPTVGDAMYTSCALNHYHDNVDPVKPTELVITPTCDAMADELEAEQDRMSISELEGERPQRF